MPRRPFILAASLTLATLACISVAQTVAPTRTAPPTTKPLATPAPAVHADAALADLTTYIDRVAKLKDDDVDGRLALGRWARDREMWSQAAEMANQALYRDPGNRAAYLILQQVDDAHPLPAEPDVEDTMKTEFSKNFGHDFKTRNTKHFLLCYDTNDTFAAQRGATMEKTYDAFQFYFNMSTLRPDFLQKRLPVILFKSRTDYLAYGQATEHADISWSAGFYSSRTNRSTFYDDSTGTVVANDMKEAEALRVKIDDLNQRINTATQQGQTGLVNTLSVERNRAAQSLNLLNNRLGNTVNMLNNSKTMHEAAHQISFNMGIQTRLVDYPTWFSEGLACCFEVEDANGRRGPALLNYGRITGLKELIKQDKVVPVDQFITADAPAKMDDASVAGIYSEGWALFHYLYKFHREGMEKYLLAYKSHVPLRAINADERKVIFIKAFGDDFDTLNKKFLAYIKSLPARP